MAIESGTATHALVAGDTIVALATPPGRGAVALIRLSGSDALMIARRHLRPWPRAARRATLAAIHDGDDVLDRALVTLFAAPHSFTGEDTVEIATHGGVVVPALVMAALVRSGARPAEPGEFTRRAVLNGKLDLVQAEAVGDLVDARSNAMRRAALAQLDGGLSRRIDALRDLVIELEALVAYDIDFPEEDDGPVSRERVERVVAELLRALDELLATAPAGELVRHGALVVIAGPPNAGKSSLFNVLLGQARAIVAEVPGTTRDAIEATLEVGEWPVRLVDTAGLRETNDVVERLGIEVSERYLAAADVVLACGDTDESTAATARALEARTAAAVLRVRTKSDLTPGITGGVSAVTGDGIATLVERIAREIQARHGSVPLDAPILTRERQRHAVAVAREEVAAFRDAWGTNAVPATVAAVHLRTAAAALTEVTGVIDVEDVLDRLFRTFCIGK